MIDAYGQPSSIEAFESLPCITTVGALEGRPWRSQGEGGRAIQVRVQARAAPRRSVQWPQRPALLGS
ncbi:hypothetical protein [Burkholderia stagnalis]|uniref:hypothetical protein n=1 Tax=Burkholderia stagnalis TaxID=1503054 RepID=UPI0012D8C32D|nr:hypothetical protein [Burkholderia stagnalis]